MVFLWLHTFGSPQNDSLASSSSDCGWSWRSLGCKPKESCKLRPRLHGSWCSAAEESCTATNETAESLFMLLRLPADAPSLPDDAELHAELQKNVEEHDAENAETCRHYHCGPAAPYAVPPMARHSMGPLPPNDYPAALEGDEHILVSTDPIFAPDECDRVVALAEAEGAGLPSSRSGKYQLGKAWIKDMPGVRAWFNEALRTKLFPTLSELFPTLAADPANLRAHSVAILKYNASHPRTDIHVDDALLAFTVALSPATSFDGGGTYFEHIDSVLEMAQGHATFRPGGVRHGGHPVHSGVRYVIGGFIALADKVEHVRRLNERGNRLLLATPQQQPDASTADEAPLRRAERLFEWGLMLNPLCTLCHQVLAATPRLPRLRHGPSVPQLPPLSRHTPRHAPLRALRPTLPRYATRTWATCG